MELLKINSGLVLPTSFWLRTNGPLFFFAGISIEENLGTKWKLNGFLQYAQKGTKVDLSSLNADNELIYKLHYVDFLPSLEYKIVDLLGLYAGASIGYLFKGTQKSSMPSGPTVDVKDFFKDFSAGTVVGAKIYFGNISLHAHWNRDFTHITEGLITDANGNSLGTSKFFNNCLQAGMTLYL